MAGLNFVKAHQTEQATAQVVMLVVSVICAALVLYAVVASSDGLM